MANVYLPLGYSGVSGQMGQVLVYQGTVVRMYVLPNDPRTTQQDDNRKIFSDIAKMRKTMGTFVKFGCKVVLGKGWPAALLQLIKADQDSQWSGSLTSWNAMSGENKDAWRSAAPFQATFNDYGQIFYRLAFFLQYVLVNVGEDAWESSAWSSTQSAVALAWWQRTVDDASVLQVGDWDAVGVGLIPNVNTTGAWHPVSQVLSHNGNYQFGDNGQSVDFYFKGRFVAIGYWSDDICRNNHVYIDSELVGDMDQEGCIAEPNGIAQRNWVSGILPFGLHHLKFVNVLGPGAGKPNVDFICVRNWTKDKTPWRVNDQGAILVRNDGAQRMVGQIIGN